MHWGFALLGILPEPGSGRSAAENARFAIDYTFWLNLGFLALTGTLAWLRWGGASEDGADQEDEEHGGDGEDDEDGDGNGGGSGLLDRVLLVLAGLSFFWLAGGAAIALVR